MTLLIENKNELISKKATELLNIIKEKIIAELFEFKDISKEFLFKEISKSLYKVAKLGNSHDINNQERILLLKELNLNLKSNNISSIHEANSSPSCCNILTINSNSEITDCEENKTKDQVKLTSLPLKNRFNLLKEIFNNNNGLANNKDFHLLIQNENAFNEEMCNGHILTKQIKLLNIPENKVYLRKNVLVKLYKVLKKIVMIIY